MALFPAHKGRAEEMLDLLVYFFQGAGKQRVPEAIGSPEIKGYGNGTWHERGYSTG